MPAASDVAARFAARRGIATVWIVLAVPALLTLFVVLVDLANLWTARVELQNGAEAAALAAVKEWGDASGGPTLAARNAGGEYAAANTILGAPLVLDLNYDDAATNENAACEGSLVFGAVTNGGGSFVFEPNGDPESGDYGVRVRVTAAVASLWGEVFGTSLGPFSVSASAVARYEADSASPQLVQAAMVACDSP